MVTVGSPYMRRIFGQHTVSLRLRLCIPYVLRVRLGRALTVMYIGMFCIEGKVSRGIDATGLLVSLHFLSGCKKRVYRDVLGNIFVMLMWCNSNDSDVFSLLLDCDFGGFSSTFLFGCEVVAKMRSAQREGARACLCHKQHTAQAR